MTEEQIKRGALQLLKKARAWFASEDRLVRDWTHRLEDSEGFGFGSRESSNNICRACIMGGLDMVTTKRTAVEAYDRAESLLLLNAHFSLMRPHRLNVVHRTYDRAIARLEKELAAAPHAR